MLSASGSASGSYIVASLRVSHLTYVTADIGDRLIILLIPHAERLLGNEDNRLRLPMGRTSSCDVSSILIEGEYLHAAGRSLGPEW